MSRLTAIPLLLCLGLASPCIAGTLADTVTVGTNSAPPGASVDVPVYIRDSSGTVLGIDQPSGSRIQSFSLKVNYTLPADVQSVTFTRGGITAGLTPSFESSPSGAGTVTLIATFSETTNLIPFTSNAPAPGNQVATLHFTLAAGATVGDVIALTLDSTLTQLSNEGGTTTERTSNGNLTLVNGQLTVTPPTPVQLQHFEVQ